MICLDDYGRTVRAVLFRAPYAVVSIVTFVLAVTGDVRTLNEALLAPAGIVTVDAVGAATVPLLLDRVTTTPDGGAAHSSVSVPPQWPRPSRDWARALPSSRESAAR